MDKSAVVIYSNTVGGHEFQTIELIKDLSSKYHVDIYLDNKLNVPRSGFDKLNNRIYKLDLYKSGNFIIQLIHSLHLRYKYRHLFKDYKKIIISGGTIEATISLSYALWGIKTYAYVPMYIDRGKLWKSKLGYIYNVLHYFFVFPLYKLITINKIQAKLFSKYIDSIIVPNRINESYGPCQTIIRDKIDNNRRLYFVGRLEKTKGIVELIDLLDIPENPFEELLIFGDGSLTNIIKKKSDNAKYIKIKLIGWVDSKRQNELLKQGDIYITNSFLEGEPLAIREANQRGSLVIASNIDGHRGCVAKCNRFSNKTELVNILNKAYNNELKQTNNYSIDEIETIRKRGIEQISL